MQQLDKRKPKLPNHPMICFRKHTSPVTAQALEVLWYHCNRDFGSNFTSAVSGPGFGVDVEAADNVRLEFMFEYMKNKKPRGEIKIIIKPDEVDVHINICIEYGADIYRLYNDFLSAIRPLLETSEMPDFSYEFPPYTAPISPSSYFSSLKTIHETLKKVSAAMFPLQAFKTSTPS